MLIFSFIGMFFGFVFLGSGAYFWNTGLPARESKLEFAMMGIGIALLLFSIFLLLSF